MAQQVVTRTQRRNERKQLALAIVLILAVAGASFYLGKVYGEKTMAQNIQSWEQDSSQLSSQAQVKLPQSPSDTTAQENREVLTFYENLPKGKQAPLGSGINLPPEKVYPEQTSSPKVQPEKTDSTTKKEISQKPVSPDSGGGFLVQVASFRTAEDAEKLASRLQNYGLHTYIEQADLGQKGTWHRVLSGPFDSREKADQTAQLLRDKERISALVRQR
jgi:cell division septation protein DedD